MLRTTKILLLVCLIAAVTGFAYRTNVKGVAASFRIGPDSNVVATATVSLTRPLKAGDAIRYKFYRDGVVVLNEVPPGAPLTYTASNLPAPAYGATACYHVGARIIYANGSQSGEKPSEPWCYTRPVPPEPPAEIEGVTITPAEVALGAGGTVQFTATAR